MSTYSYSVAVDDTGSGSATIAPASGKTVYATALWVQFLGTGGSGTVTISDSGGSTLWNGTVSGAAAIHFINPISASAADHTLTATCAGATVRLAGGYDVYSSP